MRGTTTLSCGPFSHRVVKGNIMAKNQIKHEVFKDAVIKSSSTSPSLGGTTNGCEGHPKAEGMPYPLVTFVNVKTGGSGKLE